MSTDNLPSIPAAGSAASYPLSWAQQGAWLYEQLTGSPALMQTVRVLRVEGPLDPHRLRGALAAQVARFDVLRSRVRLEGTEPVQEATSEPVVVRWLDLLALPRPQRQDQAREALQAALHRAFDLEHEPLYRFYCFRLAVGEHLLLLNFHHLVFDGHSIRVFLDGFHRAYAGELLPRPRFQYADYVRWQQARLASGELAEAAASWRRLLGGDLRRLALPSDRPRPAVADREASFHNRVLPAPLLGALKQLRRERGTTLLRTVFALSAALMHRLSGDREFLLGTPLSGRSHPELKDQVGFFVNTVGLRLSFAGDPTFAALLAQVDHRLVEAIEHQDYPFEKLAVGAAAGDGDPTAGPGWSDLASGDGGSRQEPPFAAVCMQRFRTPTEVHGELTFSHWEAVLPEVLYELVLTEVEVAEGLLLMVQYRRQLFDATTIARWLGAFERLAWAVVRAPERPVSALEMLAANERQQLLVEVNDTAAHYPAEVGLAALVARQVETRPDAVALMADGPYEEWTSYAALNTEAAAMAAQLRACGAGPGEVVALLLPRSRAAVVSLLAAIQAEAAYLPLDPSYPAERLSGMLADAHPAVLVSAGELPAGVEPGGAARLDLASWPEPPAGTGLHRGPWLTGDAVAYLMYTSGSTGKAKAVVVPQRAVCRLVMGTDYVRFGAGDRVAHASNISFDAATFEVWGALLNGGRLAVFEREVLLAPRALARRLGELATSVLFLTPALFNRVVGEVPDCFAGVGVLVLGGEALEPAWVRTALAAGAPRRLVNGYGPTEATTFSTAFAVGLADCAGGSIPIGRPIENSSAYVVDAAGELCPLGVSGELLLGGAGLAQGYWRRPRLTAERFVPDRFAARPGARLYRSGDLCRRRQDGVVDFLGRRDHQVKVRGFRIELGEVEIALGEHPQVRSCAVVAPASRAGSRSLVAFVVAPAASMAELAAYLGERLPAFMVPARWEGVDSLPLTDNGKVDRRQLERLAAATEPAASTTGTAPANAQEAALAAIWAEELGLASIGVEDDFHDLGGHSLLAIRIVARQRDELGLEVGIRGFFEARTVRGLAGHLVAARPGAAATAGEAGREGPETPLSFGQERLWFIDQLLGQTSYYVSALLWSLHGDLDVAALHAAFATLVARHEVLRSAFRSRDGVPFQEVALPRGPQLPVVDLTGLDPAHRDALGTRLLRRRCGQRIPLATPGPIRLLLVRHGSAEHGLACGVHHIAFDGESIPILARELSRAYASHRLGEAPALAPLGRQYGDFARWQRSPGREAELAGQLSHWRAQLTGAPPVLELPHDRPRPVLAAFRAGQARLALSGPLVAALRGQARRANATLFMVVMASFKALASRLSGQRDIVVGTPIADRSQAGTTELIGLFVNALPLRSRLLPGQRFRELVGDVRATTLDALAHAAVPFERLVDAFQPQRDLSREPLFQVILQLLADAGPGLDLPGVEVEPLRPTLERTSFDLVVTLRERPTGEVDGDLLYARDLFDPTAMERLVRHWRHLLAAVASDAEAVLDRVVLLSTAEQAQLVGEWNDATAAWPPATTPELVASWVVTSPESVAVVDGGHWTYAGVWARAAALAARLPRPQHGEGLLALVLPRSVELVVGSLAAWMGGQAFLPLDAGDPLPRLRATLARAAAGAVRADGPLAEALASPDWQVLREEAVVPAGQPPGRELAASPERLAYVIFTSGSTGVPKGVELAHGGLYNLVRWFGGHYGLAPGDRCSQVSGTGFDAAVFETWPCLGAGATLVIVDEEVRAAPRALVGWLAERRADVVWLPTPLTAAVSRERWPAGGGPRVLTTAGDRLTRGAVRGLPVALDNLYGPTEATVMATWSPVRPGEHDPPIGRPMTNVAVYVLDRVQQAVPIGVVGELHIGGIGVARGYRALPARTAESFVPDPSAAAVGSRLYRTGDLVRRRADGEIDFLRRADHQVKVRGFRVEIGEIESALAGLAGVREAVVVARRDGAEECRLVAYVVPTAGGGPGATGLTSTEVPALRAALAERLPAYMVPAQFQLLAALPLGPTGKVDRAALPAPAREVAEAAPANELETRLLGIWRQVLGAEAIATDDSFFELGGHSLLATQLLSRVREQLGRDVSLRAFFAAPTVAGLARALESAALAAPRPPLLPLPRGAEAPLSFTQERMWFVHQLSGDSLFFHGVLSWRLVGDLDVHALARALFEIVRRHTVLRTSIPLRQGRPRPLVRAIEDISLAVVDLAALASREREATLRRLLAASFTAPIDLAWEPMVRLRLWRLQGPGEGGAGEHQEYVLSFIVHHLAFDGWSRDVFARELGQLYQAFAAGLPSPLPRLGLQYGDFAAWQRSWLRGEVLAAQLAAWRAHLGPEPQALELAGDRPRPARLSPRAVRRTAVLPPEVAGELRRLSREQGSTLFTTLLALYCLQLHQLTGRRDVTLAMPVANRGERALEALIGCFVNVLPLRVEVEPRLPLRAWTQRVGEAVVHAHLHQDLPFEQLVEALELPRDPSRHPLVQVTFQLNQGIEPPLRLAGLRVEPLYTDVEAAAFDLSLMLAQDDADGEVRLLVLASRDLYDPSTIERIARGYVDLVSWARSHPEAPLASAPRHSPAQRQQVLCEWNDAARALPPALTADRLFQSWALAAPDQVAVVEGDESWSFGFVERWASEIARDLVRRGVGPERIVGLALPRGAQFSVAAVGVVKAGGAYLPLDPSQPPGRLAATLADAGARWLITAPALAAVAAEAGCERLDVLAAAAVPAAALPEPSRSRPDCLMYVIYTSGSTGRPKGVAIENHPFLNLLCWVQDLFDIQPGDHLSQVTALTFDASVFELWSALAWGARLQIAPDETRADPPALLAWVSRVIVRSTVIITPLAEPMFDLPWPPETRVESWILGGDRLRRRGTHPNVASIYNCYGPTEVTVATSAGRVSPDVSEEPTIGRPVDNLRLHVVDASGELAATGSPGELQVAGIGLARGYLHRPQLTAAVFVPDPWGLGPGERLYRTGDLVRRRHDGELEFFGRIDQQVKVRGFRIETGEIEVQLRRLPTVQDVAVVALPTPRGDLRLVAYVVPRGEGAADVAAWRTALRAELPDYMVPSAFVCLAQLPLNANGKLDRRALPDPGTVAEPEADQVPETDVERIVSEVWREVLGVEFVGRDSNFFELGGHSLLLVQVHERLSRLFDASLTVVDLFQYPTVSSLVARLTGTSQAARPQPRGRSSVVSGSSAAAVEAEAGRVAIAVVGMAARVPGAESVEDFWQLLAEGREAISFFTPEEDEALRSRLDEAARASYVGARGVLTAADCFDAPFFDMTPREAELMDPQHRLFLETSWLALEDAGLDPATFTGRVGVFAGSGQSGYWQRYVEPAIRHLGTGAFFQALTSNEKDFLATRVAYRLNLRGPAVNVQTACSTSLVAVHQACRSLLAGECEAALAGGVSIGFPQRRGYLFQEGGIYSPDGHCRTFDARAGGTVSGNGVGVVVLKRLADAQADGDPIRAVIRGSAINNDGSLKVGFTAPSVDGQVRVIRQALAEAEVDPAAIGLVEAHGTATELGDPIEVEALRQAFGPGLAADSCALGSVKTNLGHLDAAAGVTGLIKTVLALEAGELPPSLHFEVPNPRIDFTQGPFYVNTRRRPWPRNGKPRGAAVSSFGLGGTNAHVVLEERPHLEPSDPSHPWQLLVLSARSPAALERQARALGEGLERRPGRELADVAFSLQLGRSAFEHRHFVVAQDMAAAATALGQARVGAAPAVARGSRRRIAFMFAGYGPQRVFMGRELYEQEPVFRQHLDRCAEIFIPHLGRDLRQLLFPAEAAVEEAEDQLRRVSLACPAIASVQLALAELWRSWGIEPESLIGYSNGEMVAACLAGSLSREDALALVAARSRLIETQKGGSMLSILRPEAEVASLLPELVSMAVVTDPGRCVVAGSPAAIAELEARLQAAEITYRPMPSDSAYHSWMMEPIMEAFSAAIATARLAPPSIPFVSNLTGTWITAEQATDPGYWARQMRHTVRFSDGVATLLADPDRLLLEVGPGQGLTRAALRHPVAAGSARAIPSLDRGAESSVSSERAAMLSALGSLWQAGVAVPWRRLHAGQLRRKVSLPGYAFERRRYWLREAGAGAAVAPPEVAGAAVASPQPPATVPPVRAASPAAHLAATLGGAPAPQATTAARGQAARTSRSPAPALLSHQLEMMGQQLALSAQQVQLLYQRGGGLLRQPLAGRRAGPSSWAPCTPVQHWYLDWARVAPHHFNMARLYRLAAELSPRLLAQAWQAVVAGHPALGVRIARGADGGWAMVATDPRQLALMALDLSAEAAIETAVTTACERLQASLDLARGPLARAAYLHLGHGRPGRLFVVCHHLVVDVTSWRILEEDLEQALRQLAAGSSGEVRRETTSYLEWAQALAGLARQPLPAAEAAYWLRAEEQPGQIVPRDHAGADNVVASERAVGRQLDAATTRALGAQLGRQGWQLGEALIAAVAVASATLFSGRAALLLIEGHGREEDLLDGVDLGRTVGWLTAPYPLHLALNPSSNPELAAGRAAASEQLAVLGEQIRRLPRGGIGYGLLRYLGPDPGLHRRLAALPEPAIAVNYLGGHLGRARDSGTERWLQPAPEPIGAIRDPAALRPCAFEVNGWLAEGCLRVEVRYSENLHRAATAEALADGVMAFLGRQLAATEASRSRPHTDQLATR